VSAGPQKWWNDPRNVHSKVLQKVVQRLYDNLSTLRGRKENGYRVRDAQVESTGRIPQFHLQSIRLQAQNTSGRTRLWLSKLGDIAHLPPRPARRRRNQDSYRQAGTDREVVRHPSASKHRTTHRRSRRIPSSGSVSTWGFSSTLTTRTVPPLNLPTFGRTQAIGTRTARRFAETA